MTRHQGLACLAVTVALVSTGACGRDAASYLAKGKELAAQGKLEDAAMTLRKALQQDPALGPAYLELGLVYQKQRQWKEAYQALQQAVERLPESDEAKKQLADLTLTSYLADPTRPQALYSQIDRLSRKLLDRNPNSFDGHRLQGHLGIVDRKPEYAVEHFRKAAELKPGDPAIVQALTQALFQLDKPKEAEETALRLVEKQKDFGPIYDVLYRYYQDSKRAEEAEQLMIRKAASNPKNAGFALELAAHYARMKKPDQMKTVIQRLLDHPADFPTAKLQIGDLYLALGDTEQARRYYLEGASSSTQDKTQYQKRLATLLIGEQKREQAITQLDEVIAAKPGDVTARAVRAGLLLERPSSADRARGVKELRDLVAANPANVTLRYALGRALVNNGNPDQARKEFEAALDRNRGALPPRYSLADLDLERGDGRSAIARASEILQERPGDLRAKLIHARGLALTGALAESEQELRGLLEQNPDAQPAAFALGDVYLKQKKAGEAEALYRKLLRPDTESLQAAQGLAQAYLLRKEPAKAVEILRSEVAKSPGAAAARLALASAAEQAGQYQTAIDEYKLVISGDPKSGSVRHLLATAYELKGDHEAALAELRTAIQVDPANPRPLLLLGQLLDAQGKSQEAIPVYRKLVELKPNDGVALNNLASALSETDGNLDEALGFAQRAQKVMGQHPTVSDTLGWIYVKKKMPAVAVQIFQNLVQKNPDNPTYHYHLGVALREAGNPTAAKAELETALRKSPKKLEEQKIRALL